MPVVFQKDTHERDKRELLSRIEKKKQKTKTMLIGGLFLLSVCTNCTVAGHSPRGNCKCAVSTSKLNLLALNAML